MSPGGGTLKLMIFLIALLFETANIRTHLRNCHRATKFDRADESMAVTIVASTNSCSGCIYLTFLVMNDKDLEKSTAACHPPQHRSSCRRATRPLSGSDRSFPIPWWSWWLLHPPETAKQPPCRLLCPSSSSPSRKRTRQNRLSASTSSLHPRLRGPDVVRGHAFRLCVSSRLASSRVITQRWCGQFRRRIGYNIRPRPRWHLGLRCGTVTSNLLEVLVAAITEESESCTLWWARVKNPQKGFAASGSLCGPMFARTITHDMFLCVHVQKNLRLQCVWTKSGMCVCVHVCSVWRLSPLSRATKL